MFENCKKLFNKIINIIIVTDCPVNSTLKCLDNGAEVLYENGYSTNYILEDSLGNLFVFIVWSVLGYWGLKREENKGYAY